MNKTILIWAAAKKAPWVHYILNQNSTLEVVAWGHSSDDLREECERLDIQHGDDLRALTAEHKPDFILLWDAPDCDTLALSSALGDQTKILALTAPSRQLRGIKDLKASRIVMIPALKNIPGMVRAADPQQVLQGVLQLSITHSGPTEHMDTFTRTWMAFAAMIPFISCPEFVVAAGQGGDNTKSIQVFAWQPDQNYALHIQASSTGPERHMVQWQGNEGILQATSHGYTLWQPDGNIIDSKQESNSMTEDDWLKWISDDIAHAIHKPFTDESYLETAMACTQAAWMAIKSGYPVEISHVFNMAGK